MLWQFLLLLELMEEKTLWILSSSNFPMIFELSYPLGCVSSVWPEFSSKDSLLSHDFIMSHGVYRTWFVCNHSAARSLDLCTLHWATNQSLMKQTRDLHNLVDEFRQKDSGWVPSIKKRLSNCSMLLEGSIYVTIHSHAITGYESWHVFAHHPCITFLDRSSLIMGNNFRITCLSCTHQWRRDHLTMFL